VLARILRKFSFGKYFEGETENQLQTTNGANASKTKSAANQCVAAGSTFGPISTIVSQATGGDSFPLAETAETPMRCFPTSNSIRGLVAVIPFIMPFALAGAGTENSL
jgi:hypothetical protein